MFNHIKEIFVCRVMSCQKEWFQDVFGFDEQKADRDVIQAHCRKNQLYVGTFEKVGKTDMPIEILDQCTSMNVMLYMCIQHRTNNVGFLHVNQKQCLVFCAMRDIHANIEVHSEEHGWQSAFPHQLEAFHIYRLYMRTHAKQMERASPFFPNSYRNIVLIMSAENYAMPPTSFENGSDSMFFCEQAGIVVEHVVTSDIIREHDRAVHDRKERALFQATSLFNYLHLPSSTAVPSDGIRHYYCTRTQGAECALVSPTATLSRNWLENSDDVQHNGLAPFIQANGLYRDIQVTNGQVDLTERSKASIAKGNGIRLCHAVTTDSPTLRMLVENALQMGVTRAPIQLRQHPSIIAPPPTQNSIGGLVVTAWCASISFNRPNMTNAERSALRPLALAVLQAAYVLTLQTAVYHPFVQTVYLTDIGKPNGIPAQWTADAINHAIKQFKFAPLKIVVLHVDEMDPTLQKQVVSPVS